MFNLMWNKRRRWPTLISRQRLMNYRRCLKLWMETERKDFVAIQGVPGEKDPTSGECFLGHTLPI
jgi:hypothetical protein